MNYKEDSQNIKQDLDIFDMLNSDNEDVKSSSKDSQLDNSYDEALESLFGGSTPTKTISKPIVKNPQPLSQPSELKDNRPIINRSPQITRHQIQSQPIQEKLLSSDNNHGIKHDFSGLEEVNSDFNIQDGEISSKNQDIVIPEVLKPSENKTLSNSASNILDNLSSVKNEDNVNLSSQEVKAAAQAVNKTPEIDLQDYNKEQSSNLLNNLMGTGRKSDVHSYSRFKKKKINKSFFTLEHSTKYIDPEDVSYDKYYEDILTLDAEEVEKQEAARAKATKTVVTITSALLGVIIAIAIFL